MESELVRFAGDKEADDETEQAQDGGEDFDDEDLDEAGGRCVSDVLAQQRTLREHTGKGPQHLPTQRRYR